jgi:hypothetical protein
VPQRPSPIPDDLLTECAHLRLDWTGNGLGFDLELRSELPAIHHGAALDRMGLPGAERDHYEAVGRLSGMLAVDAARTQFDGVFWRDHTWGVRELELPA